MGEVTDYLDSRDSETRAVLARVIEIAREVVPEAEEGNSYGMPALLHRGKGLVAALEGKRFLSVYPFSGQVIGGLGDLIDGFDRTTGSLHFSVERPLPDDAVRLLVEARRAEIDERAP